MDYSETRRQLSYRRKKEDMKKNLARLEKLQKIVQEKELRQKELMKMMSVTESDLGWSWFLTFFLFHIITATIMFTIKKS